MDTDVWVAVERGLPEVYVFQGPVPSYWYCNTSATVPPPPIPAVNAAETLLPLHIAPAAGVGVNVPAIGSTAIFQVTLLADD